MRVFLLALALLVGLAHAAVTVQDSENLHVDSPAIQLTAEFALVSLAIRHDSSCRSSGYSS
jgi:hypothetical protein